MIRQHYNKFQYTQTKKNKKFRNFKMYFKDNIQKYYLLSINYIFFITMQNIYQQ